MTSEMAINDRHHPHSNHSSSQELFEEEELLMATDLTNNSKSDKPLQNTLLQQLIIDESRVTQHLHSKEIIIPDEDTLIQQDESSGMSDSEEPNEMKENWGSQQHKEMKQNADSAMILDKTNSTLNSFSAPPVFFQSANDHSSETSGSDIHLKSDQKTSQHDNGLIFENIHSKLSPSTRQEKQLISPDELDYHSFYDVYDHEMGSKIDNDIEDDGLNRANGGSELDFPQIHKNTSFTDSNPPARQNLNETTKGQTHEQSDTPSVSVSIPFICVQFCPHGYYADTTQMCRTCHSECVGCRGSGPDNCTSCQHYKLGSTCVVSCNVSDSVGINDSECVLIIKNDDEHSIPAIYYAVPPIVITITAAWLLFIHYRRKRKMLNTISWQTEGMRRGDVVKKQSCEHLQQAHNDHKKVRYAIGCSRPWKTGNSSFTRVLLY